MEIAVNSPEVKEALGFTPTMQSALMPNVKTALNHTDCESSRHLCVAPTFVLEDEGVALWAIIDLTDERLAGIRWTDLGSVKRIRPTEQSIQRDNVYEHYCKQKQSMAHGNWSFNYIITSSDGLEISNVRFQGKEVLRSAKLVDWHVSYSHSQGFGYSDATGCPKFSSAAVGALSGPELNGLDSNDGFAFVQDFFHPLWPAPCNYRYKQRFEFYDDGRIRIAAGQYGRGCGMQGTYRPVIRILPVPESTVFEEWQESGWKEWGHESYRKQTGQTHYDSSGFQYRVNGESQRWGVEPGRGQFKNNRFDNAYMFVTRYEPMEGDMDMVTIGACCNTDHRQGPNQFVDKLPEAIHRQPIVLWYVPELESDYREGSEYCWADTTIENGLYNSKAWPCYGGPMLVPLDNE